MQKFRQTGQVPQVVGSPLYGDFSSATDFLTAQVRLKEAEAAFLTIPADIRRQFNDDPAELIEFINDPDNALEAADMGLIELAQPEPQSVPKTPSTPPAEPQTPPAAPQEPQVTQTTPDASG